MNTPRGLVVTGAHVSFGARPGLHGVDLSVARGERVALLGPSGCGKTSLLRAVAGLQPLTSGAIAVDGTEVTGVLPEQRGIVYMHQSPSLFDHLSVIDNVGFPLEVRGTPRRQARERAAALLDRVQLARLAHRASDTLSGGQRHRVALARALAANPAVLLLDEPFAALDPELRAEVRETVLDLLGTAEWAPAVVVVTHDVDEAAAMAHRVAILLDGRLAQVASPEHLLNAPVSVAVARLLGLPNVLTGIRAADGRVSFALDRCDARGAVGQVAVVVRVNAVRFGPPGAGTPARVVSVQHRLAGTIVRVDVAGEQVTGIPAPGLSLAAGDRVGVLVDPGAVHVLDEALGGRDV
ncbi:MAG: ABC transporter ATP-binding protein [Acidobacteria bacterium]|nr:ABC transporter ATP-binding protein [Acidobacteriota bacterium]